MGRYLAPYTSMCVYIADIIMSCGANSPAYVMVVHMQLYIIYICVCKCRIIYLYLSRSLSLSLSLSLVIALCIYIYIYICINILHMSCHYGHVFMTGNIQGNIAIPVLLSNYEFIVYLDVIVCVARSTHPLILTPHLH